MADIEDQAATNDASKKKLNLTYWLAVPCTIVVFAIGFGFGKGRLSFAKSDSIASSDASTSTSSKDLDFDSVQKLYSVLKDSYDGTLDTAKLNEGLKEGLARAVGDPYTEYFTQEKEKSFSNDLNGKFSGIGAELARDGDNLIVQSPITGAPAEKAGVRAKDIIAQIDGESAYGLAIDAAVKKIRGEKGTVVKLTLLRDGKDRIDVDITRDEITIPSVTSKILDGNIGYIQVSRFAQDTGELSAKAAQDFTSKNVKGIVLDMRNNPGGYLDAAVSLSGNWIKSGDIVVDERHGEKTVKTFKSSGNASLGSIPTVVLINEGSASASEITAGALRDSVSAILVGTKSFGKGVVQEIKPLGSTLLGDDTEGALKVTVAKWFTPKGQNINKEGLKPDIEIELKPEDITAAKDSQLDRALERLKTGK